MAGWLRNQRPLLPPEPVVLPSKSLTDIPLSTSPPLPCKAPISRRSVAALRGDLHLCEGLSLRGGLLEAPPALSFAPGFMSGKTHRGCGGAGPPENAIHHYSHHLGSG